MSSQIPEEIKQFDEQQKRMTQRAKPFFWICTVFGVIVGVTDILFAIFMTTAAAEEMAVVGQNTALAGFLILLLGSALIADCYLLAKGIAAARLWYGIFIGIQCLLVLSALMTGIIDITEYPELAVVFGAALVPLLCALVFIAVNKWVKEYMYELETSSSSVDKRRGR